MKQPRTLLITEGTLYVDRIGFHLETPAYNTCYISHYLTPLFDVIESHPSPPSLFLHLHNPNRIQRRHTIYMTLTILVLIALLSLFISLSR